MLARYAHQTERLQAALLELAHASGAEMAARVARLLGYVTSGDTLIRRQRREQFTVSSPRVLGVDEFSFRRNTSYGTLLVDLERHRPVDMLGTHRAESLSGWFEAHPAAEVLARDRDGAIATAARAAIPNTLQVADRFHLVRNVGDALKDLLHAHHWQAPARLVKEGGSPILSGGRPSSLRENQPTELKRNRWEAVKERSRQGYSPKAIAGHLRMDHRTVRRYLSLDRPPIGASRRQRARNITPYMDALRALWEQECHSGRELYRRLVKLGYRGSEGRVYAAVKTWREKSRPTGDQRAPPLYKLVLPTWRKLSEEEKTQLGLMLEVNPELSQGHSLKERFLEIIAKRDTGALEEYVKALEESGFVPFQSLARGFRRDAEAIRGALMTPWSTGQCEGQITRVKLIKRLGYGRAKADLLRQRILHRLRLN